MSVLTTKISGKSIPYTSRCYESVRLLLLRWPMPTRLFVASILTGLLAGVGAWLLKQGIRYLSLLLTSGTHSVGWNWIFLLAPLLAMIAVGWLQRRVYRRNVSRGTDKLRKALAADDYKLAPALTVEPVVACAMTIGGGCSAGAEGPIAYAGGAIGSNMARLFSLSPVQVRMMLIFGAAAGIAAIFKAPLGGVFFALEVLGISATAAPIVGLVCCCLIAGFTAFLLSGQTPGIIWADAAMGFDYSQIWWLIPIALIIGLYCRWYQSSGRRARELWVSVKSPLLRNAAAGLSLGLMVLLMPTLYGEGYGALTHVLDGDTGVVLRYTPWADVSATSAIAIALCGILLVKGIAVYTTNNAGGVAGSFAPTLFIGGMAGALIAMGADAVGCSIPDSQIVYLCMAGAMAGIVRAPLMATFITVEITASYSMLLPVTVVAFIAYWVATGWRPTSLISGRNG